MSGLLEGRGVVITGAGRGLGRSFALAVARAGAGVVVNDIDVEEAGKVVAEIEADGGRAVASGASVTDWDQAGEMIDGCVRAYGAVDGLVNNAIAYTHFGPPWDQDADQIRTAVEVGVTGTLFCGVRAIRHMKERGSGSIVNLSSRGLMGMPGTATYSAIKGAAASATYGWALDLMAHGIRVNALAPGAHTRAHDLAAAAGMYAPSSRANAVSPDIVAPAVVYLLSDLSRGITGQMLAMLGGRLGLMRRPGLLDHVVERERWTAEEIAEVVERDYLDLLQPVGIEARAYERPEGPPATPARQSGAG